MSGIITTPLQASIKQAAEVEAELRGELEEQASKLREGEERSEREQARLRSELELKETAYKEHQTQSIEYQKKLQEQLQGRPHSRGEIQLHICV